MTDLPDSENPTLDAVTTPRDQVIEKIKALRDEGKTETQVQAHVQEFNCNLGDDRLDDHELKSLLAGNLTPTAEYNAKLWHKASLSFYDGLTEGEIVAQLQLIQLITPPSVDTDPIERIAEYVCTELSQDAALELAQQIDEGAWTKPKLGKRRLEPIWIGDPEREPEMEAPKTYLDGLLYHGYVNVNGPWKKAHKTWFWLAAGWALHTGCPFLGRRSDQVNVTWLQRDMDEYQFVKQYSHMILEGMQFPVKAMPVFTERVDLLKTADQAILAKRLEEVGTEILIVDSGRGVSSVEESDSDAVMAITREYLCGVLRDQLGMTVVWLTHPAKGGRSSRGSGDWEAAADSVMRFIPHYTDKEENHVDHIHIFGEGRHPSFDEYFRVQFNDPINATEAVVVQVDPEEEKSRRHQDVVEEIFAIVREVGSVSSRNEMERLLKKRGVRFSNKDLSRFIYQAARVHKEIKLDDSGGRIRLCFKE